MRLRIELLKKFIINKVYMGTVYNCAPIHVVEFVLFINSSYNVFMHKQIISQLRLIPHNTLYFCILTSISIDVRISIDVCC